MHILLILNFMVINNYNHDIISTKKYFMKIKIILNESIGFDCSDIIFVLYLKLEINEQKIYLKNIYF